MAYDNSHGGSAAEPAPYTSAVGTTYTRVATFGGSVLIAVGAPDDLWDHQRNGELSLRLLGGGSALLPSSEIYEMTLWRRPRPVSAAPLEATPEHAGCQRTPATATAISEKSHV